MASAVEIADRHLAGREPGHSPTRFRLLTQRRRAAVHLLLFAVLVLLSALGANPIRLVDSGAIALAGLASCLVFHRLYAARPDLRWRMPLDAGWVVVDSLLMTWFVFLTGEPLGIWMAGYQLNVLAAALVGGRRAAISVAALNSALYLGLLAAMLGATPAMIASGVARLVFLFGSSFYFVIGMADLREKRVLVQQLVADQARRVEELETLTAELHRRSEELSAANRRSEEAARLKSQFLANMSHELRTPLNSIIGFSEILEERLVEQVEPRYLKFLHNILGSGRHLLSLINDILDLSKIEAGRMEITLERTRLADLVAGVRSVVAGVAARSRIEIRADLPPDLPTLNVDGPKVKQILYNLMSNAIKFSPEGAVVSVNARALGAAASPLGVDTVELAVRDEGIGIRPDDQDLIFEEFRQVDGGSTRSYGGTGLGLALVRRFAEMQGGRVTVDSSLGEGSTFRVLMPVDVSRAIVLPQPAPGLEPMPLPELEEGERPVVLVVEDDPEFYRALATDLEAAGYRACRARHGEEAMRLARELRPAVLTLDLVLPGLDGWEVLKGLKADPATRDLPVIIVSMVDNHELGFALGADDYMVKPLNRTLFLERLQELMPVPPGEGGRRSTVLLIDDDPQVHELLSGALRRSGYEVMSAGGGEEGLALARREKPSVIVLDLMMPEINGFEVATRLRQDPSTARIPTVVLTAKDLSSDDRQRLSGKISALVSKDPAQRRLLFETIRRVDGRRAGGRGSTG